MELVCEISNGTNSINDDRAGVLMYFSRLLVAINKSPVERLLEWQ